MRHVIREFLSSKSATAVDLAELDASCVPIIEQEIVHAVGPRADDMYRTILPRWHAGYAALVSLEAADPAQRRLAARELRLGAERGSLSPALMSRLAVLMAAEQDRVVWQEVLAAIQPEAAPEAARIALIALNSVWPDLRNLGCGYFETHPQPEYAAWLLPRLQDDDRQVRLRTVQVLGMCGNPAALDGYRDDPQAFGLRQLLSDAGAELRWETVLAMSRLGDAQAAQELVRQSYDPHPRQREQAVLAMGESGQRRFVEHLLRRSWTETDHGVQAAMVQSLEQLVPPADRPGLAADAPISDKIKGWAEWRERQRAAPVSAGRSESPVTEGS
jgi:HEAT repeat protein